ncbi:glycine betaine ABC transporter substrate-binding protein [Abyssisolibacter fermentans]|uniref:ABC transporter substrate-binding protein n=1 Tax=Abyssisolibacter fermentans TaxID=1766203 RepID=UPI0008318BD7|nr:glycine betaine ABC transporter substrate-binding protein [Abyssisolibacter fermentans]
MKKFILFLSIAIMSLSIVACGKNDKEIVIGGKEVSEQDILVNIMAELIENKTDIKVVRKPFLGGTHICDKAMASGDLDIYPEYTGTALVSVLNEKVLKDPDEVYEKVKERYEKEKNIVWLKPFGFNNTYALLMKESKAKELGIKNLSDLSKQASNLVLAAGQEFLERADGYDGLKEVYSIEFKDTKSMDLGLTYVAVRDNKVDINSAHSTDGRIKAFKLIALEDDKQFFPPYYAAPIIRKETLDKYPELKNVLNLLDSKISNEIMSDLNAKVDIDRVDAKEVAKEWLKEQGLID